MMMTHTKFTLSVAIAVFMGLACISLGWVSQAAAGWGNPDSPDDRGLVRVTPQQEGKRFALVMGNSAYQNATSLSNPVNDARAVARALQGLGFDVTTALNANRDEMAQAIGDFGSKLTEDAVGLVFYAGHGMQVNGHNYLVPVDAKLLTEQRIKLEAIDVDVVVDQMAAAKTRVSLVILDACRNNPFERHFRSISGGLAQMNAPEGTLIAYATAPGKVASDGDGKNGLYTSELLKVLTEPGLPIEEVFKRVRIGVSHASNGAQTPWESSSLVGQFYFVPNTARRPSPDSTTNETPIDEDSLTCETLKSSTQAAAFEAYLSQFPTGKCARFARVRFSVLKPSNPPPLGPPISEDSPSSIDDCDRLAGTPPPSLETNPLHGPGVPFEKIDSAQAIPACQKAITRSPNVVRFWCQLGRAYHKAGKFNEAVSWYRRAADQGDAVAQNNLGRMYETGVGVAQDYNEAFRWYRKAADQNEDYAQNNLGWMYENGKGVAQDYNEAVRWYRRSAEQGCALAQTNLGLMYDRGKGVPQDYAEAVRWYRKAADQGFATAQSNLGVMYREGKGVNRDFGEAVRWYRKAASQGYAAAENDLGWLYETGQGVNQDYNEAVRWYRMAAEQGFAYGQNNLGWMYEKGQGVPQDYDEAVRWLRKAADQGNALAQNNLGVMYDNGYGVEQDYREAMRLYRKAADQGHALAQSNLGLMYEFGKGVATSPDQALYWYRKAAAQGNPDAKEGLRRLKGN